MPSTDLRKIQSCTQTQVQANRDTIQGCTRKSTLVAESSLGVATWFIRSDGLKVNENAGSVRALLPVSRIGKIYYFIIKTVKQKVGKDS